MHRSSTGFVATLLLLGAVLPAAAGADMRAEAEREANRLFRATRAICGADHVLAIDVTQVQPSGFAPVLGAPGAAASGAYTMYLVMSGVTLDGRDAMGAGTQWQGQISFVAKRARRISVSRDGTRGEWTPMAGGEVCRVALAYREGWISQVSELALLANLGRFARARRPACSEVPAG